MEKEKNRYFNSFNDCRYHDYDIGYEFATTQLLPGSSERIIRITQLQELRKELPQWAFYIASRFRGFPVILFKPRPNFDTGINFFKDKTFFELNTTPCKTPLTKAADDFTSSDLQDSKKNTKENDQPFELSHELNNLDSVIQNTDSGRSILVNLSTQNKSEKFENQINSPAEIDSKKKDQSIAVDKKLVSGNIAVENIYINVELKCKPYDETKCQENCDITNNNINISHSSSFLNEINRTSVQNEISEIVTGSDISAKKSTGLQYEPKNSFIKEDRKLCPIDLQDKVENGNNLQAKSIEESQESKNHNNKDKGKWEEEVKSIHLSPKSYSECSSSPKEKILIQDLGQVNNNFEQNFETTYSNEGSNNNLKCGDIGHKRKRLNEENLQEPSSLEDQSIVVNCTEQEESNSIYTSSCYISKPGIRYSKDLKKNIISEQGSPQTVDTYIRNQQNISVKLPSSNLIKKTKLNNSTDFPQTPIHKGLSGDKAQYYPRSTNIIHKTGGVFLDNNSKFNFNDENKNIVEEKTTIRNNINNNNPYHSSNRNHQLQEIQNNQKIKRMTFQMYNQIGITKINNNNNNQNVVGSRIQQQQHIQMNSNLSLQSVVGPQPPPPPPPPLPLPVVNQLPGIPDGNIQPIKHSPGMYRFLFVPDRGLRVQHQAQGRERLQALMDGVSKSTGTHIDTFTEINTRKKGILIKGPLENVKRAIGQFQEKYKYYCENREGPTTISYSKKK